MPGMGFTPGVLLISPSSFRFFVLFRIVSAHSLFCGPDFGKREVYQEQSPHPRP